MKHHLTRPRARIALLLAIVSLAVGSLVQASPSAADSITLPPSTPLCFLDGEIVHCPVPPGECQDVFVDGFPACPQPPFPCVLDPIISQPYDPCPIVPVPPAPPVDKPVPVTLPQGVLAVKDFSAFVNAQPGPGAQPRLIVSGSVTVSSPAVTVQLVPTNPQGINPRILLLDVKVIRLPRIVPQLTRTVQVRFESTNFVDLDEVNIPAFGLRLPVSVVR